ncbi:hypothetical protein KDU71_00245 [Carboxylicivirga sediminis]|uniref:Uncharacterized protein n=1 Tax=Carboxylicivirga sediminis TaxID=2006564 RepID=A0A941F069_9BACT|nr:hypothetical protein [Carboxylicivirga sediminis]MBR8533974.1 hypothetical protein [Carboxylicivirga sediminis]
MNSLSGYKKKSVICVFKKWSRKGYAIFGSLGNVVHIGRLSVDLVQWIGQVVLHVETELLHALRLEQDDDETINEINEDVLQVLVLANDAVACDVTINEHY